VKLNLDQIMVNVDDTPALDEKGKEITLRSSLIRAILSEIDGDMQPVKGEDKIKRYNLYKQIKTADTDTDFSPEDVVVLRKAVLVFPPFTCGQVRDLLV
jgi:hypothetical protein